jgi:hypothetical protein
VMNFGFWALRSTKNRLRSWQRTGGSKEIQNVQVPFEEEIIQYFTRFGFSRLDSYPNVPLFYHQGLQLLLADAHDTNIIRSVNGECAAIDVVIGRPGPRLRAELGLPGLAISGHTSVI